MEIEEKYRNATHDQKIKVLALVDYFRTNAYDLYDRGMASISEIQGALSLLSAVLSVRGGLSRVTHQHMTGEHYDAAEAFEAQDLKYTPPTPIDHLD